MSASNIIKKEGIGIVTDDYAKAIIAIYENLSKYDSMGEKGGSWVKDNLSWDIFCQKNLDIFQKALKSKKSL